MRTASALLLALVAACSGRGAGTTAPFTPSANLAESHAWVAGRWRGELRYSTGQVHVAELDFDPQMPAAAVAYPRFQTTAPHVSNRPAEFQADGDRVRLTTTMLGANVAIGYARTFFAGTFESNDVMQLTWRMEGTVSGVDGTTGSATLARVAGPTASPTVAFVESYEGEGYRLLVWHVVGGASGDLVR